MSAQRGGRRTVGIALLASAAVLVVLGALLAAGVFPVASEHRTLFLSVLLVAAVADAVIGLRFLSEF
jgi:hypothetical protein